MSVDDSALLRQQRDYYKARACEYDEWWLRQGRYDRGPELNARWFAEAAEVSSALSAFRPSGRVLELACGTGLWSGELLRFASHLTAVDSSPEMLALTGARLRSPAVRLVEADVFHWRPDETFDVIFFGFWLSHIPHGRFAAFWRMVQSCLSPGGRVFFVDSLLNHTSTAVDHCLRNREETTLRRRLNDGREFEICKVFYDPNELADRLSELGWRFDVRRTEHYFLHGAGLPQWGG